MMLVGIFGLAVSMLIYLLLDNADNHPEAVVRAGCSLDHPEANSMSLWQQPGMHPTHPEPPTSEFNPYRTFSWKGSARTLLKVLLGNASTSWSLLVYQVG